MKEKSFSAFLKFEFNNLFNKKTKYSLTKAIQSFEDLPFPNQKIFLKFYIYYLFLNENLKLSIKEFKIIEDYFVKFPKYEDLLNFYNQNLNSFDDITKNLRNYDLYKKRLKFVKIKKEAFRKAFENKDIRRNFLNLTNVSSPALTKFRKGIDYAISEETFEKDVNLINWVKNYLKNKK